MEKWTKTEQKEVEVPSEMTAHLYVSDAASKSPGQQRIACTDALGHWDIAIVESTSLSPEEQNEFLRMLEVLRLERIAASGFEKSPEEVVKKVV